MTSGADWADVRPLLEVRDVHAGYSEGHDILCGVDLQVHRGEIVCVIGPNGAGKSTVFKAVYGLVPVRSGRVLFDGRDITNIAPQDALRIAGITIRQIFAAIRRLNREIGLTVLMIEQNARQGLEASHRGYVIEMGRITHTGPAPELLADPKVRRAFLGAR